MKYLGAQQIFYNLNSYLIRSVVLAHGIFELGDDHERIINDLEKDQKLKSDRITELEKSQKAVEDRVIESEKDLIDVKAQKETSNSKFKIIIADLSNQLKSAIDVNDYLRGSLRKL